MYYLVSNYSNKVVFEEFTLIRRVSATAYVFLLLGMVVALPRQIAIFSENNAKIATMLRAAMWTVLLSGVSFLTIVACFPSFVSIQLFGKSYFAYLMFPMGLYILVQLLAGVIFSYLRGRLWVMSSNILTFSNSLAPIIAILVSQTTLQILLVTTFFFLLTPLILFLFVIKKENYNLPQEANLKQESSALLKIGIPRIPGDFALEALLTVPVTFTAHHSGTWTASIVAFGITIITMCVSFLAPINLLLLPYAAKSLSQNKHDKIREHTNLLVKITLVGMSLMLIAIEFGIPLFLSLFFKKLLNDETVTLIRWTAPACLPYSIYLVLRSFIDASSPKPLNAINASISLGILLIVGKSIECLNLSPYPYIIGMVIGFLVLGLLSIRTYQHFFKNLATAPDNAPLI
ncbi:MAG: hypothetical protein RLZZ292_506 [Bacteroidota bacterium]|jgi:O-antigen/teichoic acid export membrane protein